MRSRAWRRQKEKDKFNKRLRDARSVFSLSAEDADQETLAHFKNGHWGCGCPMCKPWKAGLEPKLKVSERKALLEDKYA